MSLLRKNLIVLIGFMGAGKSTVALALANKLGFETIDTDEEIVKQQQMPISKIFEIHSEKQFRKYETELIHRLLEKTNTIVSTGGGLPCSSHNIELLKDRALLIYLKLDAKILSNRLWNGRRQRPLIAHYDDIHDLESYVEQLLKERSPYYEMADIIIDASGSVEDTVDQIIEQWHSYQENPQ